jgi:hypothetical protein
VVTEADELSDEAGTATTLVEQPTTPQALAVVEATTTAEAGEETAAQKAMLRVRADLIDQLVSYD